MQLHAFIDHTLLKPTTTIAGIEQLCAEAIQYQFAAVCVPPPFIKLAKQLTQHTPVKVATVIGFPFGYSAIEAKIAEAVLAMVDGADELDVVANILAIKNGDWAFIASEINHLIQLIIQKQKVVKVIVESGVLTQDELIKCCDLYGAAGIHFMKTSTGYAEVGATVEAVKTMRTHLPAAVQIKASGGIKTPAFAAELIQAGATRLGTSAGVQLVTQTTSYNSEY
jgi:deoxyribose-phosphate aldolase